MGDDAVPRWLRVSAAVSWRLIIVAVAVGAVVYALAKLWLIVLPTTVALLGATILYPPAAALKGRGWPPALATAAVFLSGLAIAVGMGFLIAPAVADELGNLGDQISEGAREVGDWLGDGPLGLSEGDVDEAIDEAEETLRDSSGAISDGVVTGALLVGEIIAGFFVMLVLLFFFVKDGERLWAWIRDLVPLRHRDVIDEIGARAWEVLTAYIRGVAIVATVDAVLIGIGLWIIGVPLVLPLAVLTFVAAFLPFVGAILAGAAAALVALVSGGPVDALLVVGVVTIVQQTEGDLLYPVLVGRLVRLHPVAVLIAIATGGILAGIPGAFLAVPATAVGGSVLDLLRERSRESIVETTVPPAEEPGGVVTR